MPRELDRAYSWSGIVWRLEDNSRDIPVFNLSVIPWTKVSDDMLQFWPPKKRPTVVDPTAHGPVPLPVGEEDGRGGEEPPHLIDVPVVVGVDGVGGGEDAGGSDVEELEK